MICPRCDRNRASTARAADRCHCDIDLLLGGRALTDFLSNTIAVLQLLGVDAAIPDRTRCFAITGPIDMHVIGVVVSAHGDASGLTWEFPRDLISHLATSIAPEFQPDPTILDDAARELASLLTGRGVELLASHGVVVEIDQIEPPRLAPSAGSGIVGRLSTDLGGIAVTFHRPRPRAWPVSAIGLDHG